MNQLERKLRSAVNWVQACQDSLEDDSQSQVQMQALTQAMPLCFEVFKTITEAGHTVMVRDGLGDEWTVSKVIAIVDDTAIRYTGEGQTALSTSFSIRQLTGVKVLIKTSADVIALMAQWWAERLKSHCPPDNGESGTRTFMAVYLPEQPSPLRSERIARFQQTLNTLLLARVDRDGNLVVSVDYDPDETLQEAGRQSVILDLSRRLPIKSVTSLSEGKLVACLGYNGEPETLYESTF